MNAIDFTKGWYVLYLKRLSRSHCVVTNQTTTGRKVQTMCTLRCKVNQNNHFFKKAKKAKVLKADHTQVVICFGFVCLVCFVVFLRKKENNRK